MLKKIKYEELLVHASGEYLTEAIPKNFRKMSEKKLFTFLEDNACGPFEDHSPEALWELIDNSATALWLFLTDRGIPVEEVR